VSSLLSAASLGILFLIGVPIALSLAISGAFVLGSQGIPMNAVVQRMITSLDSFPLAAIPFFILAGSLMEVSGISGRLIDFARSMVGRAIGGLGLVTVLAAMFFAAISGSSAATTAAIGTILIPAMVRHGYPRHFATSVQAASGELGVIIPPSIPMIIFCLTAGVPVSIGDLFVAGVVPGILIAGSLMLTMRTVSALRGYGQPAGRGAAEEAPRLSRLATFRRAVLPLLMPLIVLGGIYGGIFTPTEAAIVAVFYALGLGGVVYRSLTVPVLYRAFSEALINTVAILLIISAANLFGWMLTINQIPRMVTEMFLAMSHEPWVFLLAVNILLLIVGCFMETGASIIILAPMLTPVAVSFGISPIHFGIVMIINLAIGMTTPPVGVNLFVACQIAGLRIDQILKSMIPFYLVLLADMAAITYLPWLSTGLPNLLR
jgi:C4-dicarboxylate transporter DctM subunit